METDICTLLFPYTIGVQTACNIADEAKVIELRDPNRDFYFKFLGYLFRTKRDPFLQIRLLLIHFFAQNTPYSVKFVLAVTGEILNRALITGGSSNGIHAEALAESIMIELGDGPVNLQASAVENADLILGFPEVNMAAASTLFMTVHSSKLLLLRLYQLFFTRDFNPLSHMTIGDLKKNSHFRKNAKLVTGKKCFFSNLSCRCVRVVSQYLIRLGSWHCGWVF